MEEEFFDVVVVGGGHAGTEAAAVCARMGVRVLLLTQDTARIGVLSCNPSIGGIGKSHLVREVDALDGLMARAADQACIHNKTLNRSKGPAVRGVRVQADRRHYRHAIMDLLNATKGVEMRSGEACGLRLSESGRVDGVYCSGSVVGCSAVVIATGTFLRGVTHVGHERAAAGRRGDAPSISLAACLDRLGLPLGRLKTGTPPRLARETIDWHGLPADWGDDDPSFLSFETTDFGLGQSECRVTETTPHTHDLIRTNLGRSALYGGGITAPGPRYCPSIEDKIVKFAHRDRHQVFLEPEGLPGTADGETIYPNGISTSLPADIQLQFVRTLPGLNRAEITASGYAVEYDFVQPTALDHSLQLRAIPGLFLAGQITGTTGYEEAAAQGIYAGMNAARYALRLSPVLLDRATSYIGVMVDDLVRQPLTEPYRMFTSRAEYRLQLRCDNADLRLTPIGIEVGCVSDERQAGFREFQTAVGDALEKARIDVRTPAYLSSMGVAVKQDGELRSVLDIIRSDQLDAATLSCFPWLGNLPARIKQQIVVSGLYDGYLQKQAAEVSKMRLQHPLTNSQRQHLRIPCFT